MNLGTLVLANFMLENSGLLNFEEEPVAQLEVIRLGLAVSRLPSIIYPLVETLNMGMGEALEL